MSFSNKHLYLMHSKDTHTDSWVSCFGDSAEEYTTLYTGNYIHEFGVYYLHHEIEEIVKRDNISLIFLEVSTFLVNPFILQKLKKKYKLTIVLFQLDDEFKFETLSVVYATIADLVLSFDYVSVDRYRQSGINAHFFMHPIYIPSPEDLDKFKIEDYKVAFLGQVTGKPSRKKLIDYLIERGVEIEVIETSGSNFLERDHMHSVFRNTQINLSFCGITDYIQSDNPLQEMKRGTKSRHLEIASSGGFCISEYSIAASKHLEEDREIVFFTTKEDLFNKIQFYLENEGKRKEIATSARKAIKERFSNEAVSSKLSGLIQGSRKFKGKNLYGESLDLICSRYFAFSYIAASFPYSFRLLLKGKLRTFLLDMVKIAKFISEYISNKSLLDGFLVFIISIYHIIKSFLAELLTSKK